MRPRVQITLNAPSSVSLTSAIAACESRFPNANRFFDKPFNWVRHPAPDDVRFVAVFHARITTRAFGDSFWTNLQTAIATLRSAGVTGLISYHQCTHDEAVKQDCRIGATAAYQEIVI